MAVDRDKVLQAAQKLVEKKRYDKAVAEYQKILAEEPNDVRTLLKIGDLYLKMELHTEAITTYERVGQFYSSEGFAVKALAVYKQIREIIQKQVPHLEDRFGHIIPRLAELFNELGLPSDALAAYDELATRYQRQGRDRDAIDVFRKLVDLDPQNPLPYLRLAEALVRVRDVDAAIQRFGQGAEILLKLGRRDDALKVVERLLQHRGDAHFARMAAEIYLARGQANDGMAALKTLQICFKENPKDLDTLDLLARAFDLLGQPAKANEVKKEAARIAKDAGKHDAFNAILDGLLVRAPQDETVRLLAAQRAAPPPSAAGPKLSLPAPEVEHAGVDHRGSIDVEVDDDEHDAVVHEDLGEELEEFEEEAATSAPIPLRASHPEPAPPVAAAADPAARVRQILAQVEALRRRDDHDGAVAVLIEGVDELPSARELREKLCDTLLDAGDQPEAVRQLIGFARSVALAGDIEEAARLLDEVLLMEPNQPDAIATLRDLGYMVPSIDAVEYVAEESAAPPAPAQGPAYDPDAPLPAYDLDEGAHEAPAEAISDGWDGEAAASPEPSDEAPEQASHAPLTVQLDDPFDADMPLPSFPIDDESARFSRSGVAVAEPGGAGHGDPRVREATSGSEAPTGQLDEDALEEVDFFATHEMFDEARNLLAEQLERMPNHPLLLDRLREIEALSSAGSGPRSMPRGSEPAGEDRSFDIAASLDALDALDAGEASSYPREDPHQISVESVFEQFKAGVAAQISESDAATHYDLGVAYQEMGLVTDAISEFELASRDPGRECVCHSMVGVIWMQLGNADQAVNAFLRGLHANQKTRDQELKLTYEIGATYEAMGDGGQGLLYFQRLARVDPGYYDPRGDVEARIRHLEPVPTKTARVVGTDVVHDDFDEAFDDLLGGALLPGEMNGSMGKKK